jgi:arabinofuranosyltransferase
MNEKLTKSRNLIADSKIYSRLIAVGVLVLFLTILIRTAWLSDDAFITLRTLDNFINGLGLTWNPPYRVQAFTHPLWLFVLSPFYYFTREPFYTTLFVSIALSFSAVLIMAAKIRLGGFQTILALLILCCSKAFTDFATSGLENPLVYFLSVLFVLEYRNPHFTFRGLLIQTLICSLILITRQDLGLIFIPAVLYTAFRYQKWVGLFALGTGLLPWLAWLSFSIFYFGFPVPNTAYAKLQTGIPEAEIIGQGILYYLNSLQTDPITLISIAVIIIFFFRSGRKRWMVMAGSTVIYLLYVLQIGGDFMSGRFFAVPLFVLVLGLNAIPLERNLTLRISLITLIAGVGLFSPYSPVLSGKSYRQKDTLPNLMDASGIVDERGFYYDGTGLLTRSRNNRQVKHIDAERGKLAKQVGQKININGAVGMLGYYAGPNVYVVDYYGLGDPLLSRLPVVERDSQFLSFYRSLFKRESPYPWRVGHFRRSIPAGYVSTLLSHKNQFKSEELQQAWQILLPVMTEPLFSEKRLKALSQLIFEKKFNLVQTGERTPWQDPPYLEILAQDSSCVSTLYLTANLDFVQGNPLQAYQKLKRVSELSAYFVSANQKDFASAWYALAMRFSELNRFALSLDCALRAESLGIPLQEETKKELEENVEMEALFHPERTKEIN